MDNNLEQLYEMMGIYTRQSRAGRTQTSTFQQQQQYLDPRQRDIRVGKCAQLYPWQRQIVDQLRRGSDVFAIVSPGGGKTAPIICYWVQEILGINVIGTQRERELLDNFTKLIQNPQSIPQIMYLVPTRQLAQQTVQEMREILTHLLAQLMNWYLQTFDASAARIQHFERVFMPWFQRNSGMNRDEFNRFISDFRARKFQSEDYDRSLMQMYIQYLEQASMNHIDSHLLFIQTGGQRSRGNPASSPVVVTIYQSVKGPGFSRILQNVRFLICDEAHLTQAVSVHTEDPKSAEEKADALYVALMEMIPNNRGQLIFLSGTQNPQSAKEFGEYLNKHFKRNFSLQHIQVTGRRNPAHINTIPDDSLSSMKGIVQSVRSNIQTNDWGNLYVIFSTRQIQKIAEEAMKHLGVQNLDNIMQSTKHDTRFQSYYRRQEETPDRVSQVRIDPNRMSQQPFEDAEGKFVTQEARNLQNPFIRLAASHGIGIIARNVPGEHGVANRVEMDDNDKYIIANLFRDKKLKVLLATDAVGIGVNIDVKNLHIPSLQKFSNATKQHEQTTLRDLSQILNRAGRAATPSANIYTPSENIERVMAAINKDPNDFETSDVVKHLHSKTSYSILYNRMHNLHHNVNQAFKNLRRKFI